MSTPLHQAAQKALAALEVCTGRTTGAGVMRVRAIAEVREALANVDQTNTSPERVQKQPGNEHVLRMALDALEYHVAQTRPIERTTLAMGALRAALAAPQGEHDALRCAVGNCMFNGEVKSHTPNCQHSAPQGEPVKGDVLPPVGSRVYIRHGRDDDAHACTVTGYYAWGDLNGAKHLHRVFVRLVYEGTDHKQARMLCDCWSTEDAALLDFNPAPHPAAPVPPTVCPEHDEWVAQGMKPCDNPAQCWDHCGQLGKSLEHASVSQRQTCFDCAKAMIYPRPDDCWQCGKGLINAYVKEQQPGPLTATQFFTQTTNGVSGPIKSPVKFMDRPEQPRQRPQNCGTGYCSCIECVMDEPERSCATCKHAGSIYCKLDAHCENNSHWGPK